MPSDPQNKLNPFEAAARQRVVLLQIVRVSFIVLLATVTLLAIVGVDPNNSDPSQELAAESWPVTLAMALGLAVIVILIDVFTPHKKVSTLFAVFFGLLAALLATIAVGFIVDLIAASWDIQSEQMVGSVKVLIGIALTYLAVTTVLQTQDDFRLVIPYVEFAKQVRGPQPLLLDSSVLIDGRFFDVAQTGLFQQPIVIPSFVMDELQLMADSGDRRQRVKGRRGLDGINQLQKTPILDVTIDRTQVPGKAVDQMLVELARRTPGTVVTTDTALARVAKIHSVSIVNLNAIASALKPALLPGEIVTIELIRKGEQAGQGVGFLDDGTMVVVEHAAENIGSVERVVVTSSLQTAAGRLIFAQLEGAEPTAPHQAPSPNDTPSGGELNAESGDTNGESMQSAAERDRPGKVRSRASSLRNPRR